MAERITVMRRALRLVICAAVLPSPAFAADTALERELYFLATVEATQNWAKNDPRYPGPQWSKAKTSQRYELRTRLRSDGQLQVRNLLDPDLNRRLEAKTIYLARQAKKQIEASGRTLILPRTESERMAFNRRMQEDLHACKAEPTCFQDTQMRYAAIFAAIDYPEALEEDTVPGRYLYYEAYKGCPEQSRVTLDMAIDGVRYNKTEDKFLPFSERRTADTLNASDGQALCTHFLAVIDTQDPQQPMWQETIFVPRPEGITEYSESGHTSRTQESQPMPPPALDWMNMILRHAPTRGNVLSPDLPLPLSLNGNSTWLGLWTGSAKVRLQWSFEAVPSNAARAAASPH